MAVIINPAPDAGNNFNHNAGFNRIFGLIAGGGAGIATGLEVTIRIGLDVVVNNVFRFAVGMHVPPMPRICAAVITGGIAGGVLGFAGIMDRNMLMAANLITAIATGTVFTAIFTPPDNPILESMHVAGVIVAAAECVVVGGTLLAINGRRFFG